MQILSIIVGQELPIQDWLSTFLEGLNIIIVVLIKFVASLHDRRHVTSATRRI
jgi:hypothetical protein